MKQSKLLVQLILVAAMFASISLADTISFQWSTTGAFSGLPTGLDFIPVDPSAVVTTATNGDVLGLNLGHFMFSGITTDYTGKFTLTVKFFTPGSTDPGSVVTLDADVHTYANTNGINDLLTINFPGAPPYDFNGTDGKGTFTFGVDNVSNYRNGSHTNTVNLTGNITGAAFASGVNTSATSEVPEPGSVFLVCTVLIGLALTARKKLSAAPGCPSTNTEQQ